MAFQNRTGGKRIGRALYGGRNHPVTLESPIYRLRLAVHANGNDRPFGNILSRGSNRAGRNIVNACFIHGIIFGKGCFR